MVEQSSALVARFGKLFLIVTAISLMVACSTDPQRKPAPVVSIIDHSRDSISTTNKHPAARSPVIKHLLQQARQLQLKGQAPRAAAILERAIRIEPRNPAAWHQLAQVRLLQKNYSQAESLALRSNQYAFQVPALQQANWLLIARVRDLQGKKKGAEQARKNASRAIPDR